jgi:hypothetical protein
VTWLRRPGIAIDRAMNQPALVIGMHRSGTSVLTRCLSLMGLSLGPEAMLMKPQPEQPTGYWELEPLRAENDRLLAVLGGTWNRPPILASKWPDQLDAFTGAMKLRHLFPERASWVWKDPRNCLLLPYWRRCLAVLRLQPVAVFIHRHPMDVVSSLRRTRQMAPHLGLQLWSHYNESALRAMEGMPVAVVSFERLVEAPAQTLSGLAAFLCRHMVEASASLAIAAACPQRSLITTASRHRSAGAGPLYQVLLDLPAESDSFAVPIAL